MYGITNKEYLNANTVLLFYEIYIINIFNF